MKTALTRWLPALATLALLVLALVAPVRRVGAGSPGTNAVPICDLLLEQSGGSATFDIDGSAGITQPFTFAGNVQACSLGCNYEYYSGAVARVRRWNPATLTPDPSTIALRTVSITASAMQYSHINLNFDPPIILKEHPEVAEGFGSDFALELQNSYNGETVHYEPDGPAALPVARQFAGTPFTAQAPLPGTHPVIDHRICSGNSWVQENVAVQSVTTCDSTVAGAALYEVVQRFRLPASAWVQWIEFAMNDGTASYGDWGNVLLFDAEGQSAPPLTWPPTPLASALFQAPYLYNSLPSWTSHFDFDRTPNLLAGHEYWLVIRTSGHYGLDTRRRTGTESANFLQNIGSFYVRAGSANTWTELPKMNLAFRVLGRVSGSVAVPRPPLTPAAAFALSVAPSPARGPVAVIWSGARGALRIDVLDARGRRLAGAEAPAAASGRWVWNGADAAGRALPAGVYFVRARDAAHSATQRVVLVR